MAELMNATVYVLQRWLTINLMAYEEEAQPVLVVRRNIMRLPIGVINPCSMQNRSPGDGLGFVFAMRHAGLV